jgi:hypothetical protein
MDGRDSMTQTETEQQEPEALTTHETIQLKKVGNSDVLRVPAGWRNTLKELRGPLIFNAHVERSQNGTIYIVFEKINQSAATQNGHTET